MRLPRQGALHFAPWQPGPVLFLLFPGRGHLFMTSLLDSVYELDIAVGVRVRTRIENLCCRIEDLESQPCAHHEAVIEELTIKLAAANHKLQAWKTNN